MKRKIFALLFAVSIFSADLFSQNIELPEVTTVISGDTEKAGEDALPDFSDVLKLPAGSGGVEPVLPEAGASDSTDIAAGKSKPVEKSVYAEGLIGGGYPALFTGNISVARTIGASPFKFSFEHDSAVGYAKHSVTEGYSDRTTKLSLEKKYKKNHFEWGASGFYKSASDGLQGNVKSNGQEVGLLNRDLYNAHGDILYSFDNGFSAGAATSVNYYNRYPEVFCPIIQSVSFFSLEPSVMLRWQGNGFDTGFTTDYDYDTEFSDEYHIPTSHRTKFTIDLQWKNDVIRLYGNASAVVGNKVMEKSVIVPFTVGTEFSIPVYFSNRRLAIQAEGGIDSYKPKTFALEDEFKFTNLNWNPTEVSEWYGRFNLRVPLKSSFTGSAGFEYRKTAYDNRRWQPVYNDSLSIYGFELKEFQIFKTDFTLSYHQGICTLSGSWSSNWLDIPAGENNQTVRVDVNLQEEESKWGVDVNCKLPINDKVEVPVVNAEGFICVTPSVRAILSVSDFIKLYRRETRIYAGKYEARGGSAAVLLKFFF